MDLNDAKIKLTYLNGTGYIFNANDYMTLRTEHRVIGSMVGTCCMKGWSANACSLPVELTTFETQLLLERGVAVLVSKYKNLFLQPTEEELQTYKEDAEKRLANQEEHLKDGKMKESLSNIEKILSGKRKKLLKSGVLEKDIQLSQETILQEIRDSVSFDRRNALVEIHCEHPRVHEGIKLNTSTNNTLKYRVYKDFWSRGKYVTCGEAFGADFLVYPGDPIVFHASHIVIILREPTVKPLELISKVRLSVIVNKLCVLAYLNKENILSYQTVQWEGNKVQKL